MEKLSYALGLSIAGNLQKSGVDNLNLEAFTRGLSQSLKGEKLEMTTQEANTVINGFFEKAQKEQQGKNVELGKAFLAENAKKDGVVVLESGLQYEILTKGTGAIPTAADQVECHYHGTLIDGTVFDSSVERGEPATFPVGGVIQGWVEALQLMPVGSKWKLYIPSNLAYGERGAGNAIGPNTTLVFEVELIGIV